MVAPTGVFTVETKMRRKGWSGKAGHQVSFDGRALHFPDGRNQEMLVQTRRNAAWLSEHLTRATGEAVPVQPILTLPGWWIERKAPLDPAVLNQKEIRAHILHQRGSRLSREQDQRIVHQLDQKCRDVGL